jgi:hypothetical protein
MAATAASDDSSRSRRDRQARERDLVRELQEASGQRERARKPHHRESTPAREETVEKRGRKEQ